MQKKAATILTLLMAGILLVTACTSTATPTAEPAADSAAPTEAAAEPTAAEAPTEAVSAETTQPVEIVFWHGYNEQGAEVDMLVNTLIPMFEAEHPNITVKAVAVPYDSFREKLLAALSAGTAPDLIRSDIIWVPELAEMGALVPLSDAMSDFDTYKDAVFAGPLSTNYWQGKYYGLPLDTNTKVWIYNDDVYAAAGISAPASMDELEAACQAIKAVNPNAYLFAADGTYAWVTLPWLWSYGGSITDADLTTASGYINSAESVAAYDQLLKLYDAGCISPVILGDGVDPFAGLASGDYASLDNGPWTYSIMEAQYPDAKFSAAAFPAGPAGSINVVGGEDINLFQQSSHPEEAMEFMRFMLSEEYQLKMMEVGQIPVLSALVDSDAVKNHPYLGVFMQQLQTSQARTAHPAWSQIDTILTDAGQLILRKEMTPQQALDAAAEQIDALLQE